MSTQEAVSRTPLPHQTGQCLPTPTPARSFPPSLPLSPSASHPLPLTFSLALGFGTKAWPSLDTLSLSFLTPYRSSSSPSLLGPWSCAQGT